MPPALRAHAKVCTMLNIEIDRGKALTLLSGAVEKRGADYIYPNHDQPMGCTYVTEDCTGPDCMVGQALFDAGVPMAILEELDNLGSITDRDVMDRLTAEGVILTPGAYNAFSAAQKRQDKGHTWGNACTAAEFTDETP